MPDEKGKRFELKGVTVHREVVCLGENMKIVLEVERCGDDGGGGVPESVTIECGLETQTGADDGRYPACKVHSVSGSDDLKEIIHIR